MSAYCPGVYCGLLDVCAAKDSENGVQDAFLRFHRPVGVLGGPVVGIWSKVMVMGAWSLKCGSESAIQDRVRAMREEASVTSGVVGRCELIGTRYVGEPVLSIVRLCRVASVMSVSAL